MARVGGGNNSGEEWICVIISLKFALFLKLGIFERVSHFSPSCSLLLFLSAFHLHELSYSPASVLHLREKVHCN